MPLENEFYYIYLKITISLEHFALFLPSFLPFFNKYYHCEPVVPGITLCLMRTKLKGDFMDTGSDSNDNLGLQTKLYSLLSPFSHKITYQFSSLFSLQGIYWYVNGQHVACIAELYIWPRVGSVSRTLHLAGYCENKNMIYICKEHRWKRNSKKGDQCSLR